MISNLIFNKASEILSLNSSSGRAYLSSGTIYQRIISLANHPDKETFDSTNFYLCWCGSFTSRNVGSNVMDLSLTYTASTGELVINGTDGLGRGIFNTDLSTDRANWKLIIIK